MKNKKSKIIVPALGLILLSTAASISGSVAWFTANRTATINATSFAVVKTSENLSCDLSDGVGTATVDPNGSIAGSITTSSNYKLTDSSFNHLKNDEPVLPVIEPNLPRDKVAKVSALSALNDSALVRDNANHVYSAFTWDMAFTISFSEAAIADQGLFIDLSTSYMHEKVHFNVGDNVPANTYKANPDMSGDYIAAGAVTGEAKDYYKEAPDASGKAFRIAFAPLSITGTGEKESVAYTKIWAKNDDASDTNEGKFVSTSAVNADLTAIAYSDATTKLSGYTDHTSYAQATAASDKVLMKGSETIPHDGDVSAANALTGNANFLGVFKKDPGKTVTITYRCIAWFEGTYDDVISSGTTDFETIVAGMTFGVCNLQ